MASSARARTGIGRPALVTLFLVAALVIIGGGAGTVAILTHGFRKPVKTLYHQAAVFRLRPGECVNIPNGSSLTVTSCTVPHNGEVYGTFRLPGTSWPGTPAVRRAAAAGCGSRLTAYLNPQLAVKLAQAYVYPGHQDWKAGARTVICEVRSVSGPLTGSVRAGS